MNQVQKCKTHQFIKMNANCFLLIFMKMTYQGQTQILIFFPSISENLQLYQIWKGSFYSNLYCKVFFSFCSLVLKECGQLFSYLLRCLYFRRGKIYIFKEKKKMKVFYQEFWHIFLYYQKSRVVNYLNFSFFLSLHLREGQSCFKS